ncbi:alpha-hydroxy-acid oxidizing protein [Pyxidicoccus parkwayensis]|uniref:Alpha-hydroxy-acid oxidizing protein n=1 Tax=Pyxidicoccus parkwayensis TaxID=2813578 RepID=A0ABX7NP02_9BACT|nr:alpha-hydroxy acid oxidase [Pyxidicoccus parkwaysis]QSQ20591.1 alpha-hydroxy-acid oxidizing protein [Pyxidicoccus parkwaysis]
MLPYEALEAEARARLPEAVFDYYAGGAGDEATLVDNTAAWTRVRLRPRVLRDVSSVRTATELLGTPLASPVLVAPTAFHSLGHPEGELATARGTREAGSLLVLSSRASRKVEDVAAVAGPWWLQVYVFKDRGLTRALVQRAVASGARALVLTGDTPVVGRKRRDRGDAELPLPEEDFLANLEGLTRRELAEQASDATFVDIHWLRDLSGLPVLVKGVLRSDDARECLRHGASGLIVSNHGGRQLDGAVSTADALPEVVEAVDNAVPVLVDGGVRTGRDVLRALALGARAVLVGRPVLWGLATGGADGVRGVLDALREDTVRALALAGVSDVSAVGPDLVAPNRPR